MAKKDQTNFLQINLVKMLGKKKMERVCAMFFNEGYLRDEAMAAMFQFYTEMDL